MRVRSSGLSIPTSSGLPKNSVFRWLTIIHKSLVLGTERSLLAQIIEDTEETVLPTSSPDSPPMVLTNSGRPLPYNM